MNTEERLRREQGDRLRRAREAAGYRSARAAALGNDWAESSYRAHEGGTRTIGQDDAETYAKRFRANGVEISASDILFGSGMSVGSKKVPLVGYAAAGGDSVVFYGEGDGNLDEVDAPDWATKDTVAVKVRGTSLGRFLDGWIAFYDDRRDPPDESLHGQVCVCGLADKRVVVKKLRPAAAKGTFHLESETEPTMFDVPVEWAAKVREFRQV